VTGRQNGNGNDEYARHYAAAAKQYEDYDATIAAADRAGHRLSPKLEAAIRAIGNPAEIAHIAYGLAKNPQLIRELENDPSQLARISPTARHETLLNAYRERMKGDPAAAAAVAATNVMISKAVEHAILEQDNSHKVAEHFAKNPEEAEALNNLPPLAAIARVSKIAARLEDKAAAKRTRAPDPISPVGNGSSTRSGISLEEMSPRDYIRTRNAQELARRLRR